MLTCRVFFFFFVPCTCLIHWIHSGITNKTRIVSSTTLNQRALTCCVQCSNDTPPHHRRCRAMSIMYTSSGHSVYYNIFTIYYSIVQAHLWRLASATKCWVFPKSSGYWAARLTCKTNTWNLDKQSSQTTIQLPACIQKVVNTANEGRPKECFINPLSTFNGLSLLREYFSALFPLLGHFQCLKT